MTLIRFAQFDVKYDTVHHEPRGVPLPPDYEGWVPFQVEIRGSTKNYSAEGERTGMDWLTLAVWMRKEKP